MIAEDNKPMAPTGPTKEPRRSHIAFLMCFGLLALLVTNHQLNLELEVATVSREKEGSNQSVRQIQLEAAQQEDVWKNKVKTLQDNLAAQQQTRSLEAVGTKQESKEFPNAKPATASDIPQIYDTSTGPSKSLRQAKPAPSSDSPSSTLVRRDGNESGETLPIEDYEPATIDTKPPTLQPSTTLSAKPTTRDIEETYTLVVVRCRNNITWMNEVPTDWRIVVYDKCQRNTQHDLPALKISRHVPANVGAEECNGYYDYMLDYYHNLTTVTVFMHDDGLRAYDTKHTIGNGQQFHTPFDTFEPIVNSTKQFLTKEQPFLHFGFREIPEVWGKDPYHGEAMKILWPYFSVLDPKSNKRVVPKPPIKLSFKPSAHMAVRKEAIQMHPRETYYALLQQVRHARDVPGYYEPRKFCCAMERMWHIFFGQPPILPKKAIVSDLLNITKCNVCNHPQMAYQA